MDKILDTFGNEIKDGDFVIVPVVSKSSGSASLYAGVFKGKSVYTLRTGNINIPENLVKKDLSRRNQFSKLKIENLTEKQELFRTTIWNLIK